MAEKKLKTRIINKHETQEDWEKAVNFIPLLAELIVYDPDSTYTQARLKIGDGKTNVNDLPYVGQFLEVKELPPIEQANEDIIYFYKDMLFKFNKDAGIYINITNSTSLEWIILE